MSETVLFRNDRDVIWFIKFNILIYKRIAETGDYCIITRLSRVLRTIIFTGS